MSQNFPPEPAVARHNNDANAHPGIQRLPDVVESLIKENEAFRYRLMDAENRIKTLELKNDSGEEIL